MLFVSGGVRKGGMGGIHPSITVCGRLAWTAQLLQSVNVSRRTDGGGEEEEPPRGRGLGGLQGATGAPRGAGANSCLQLHDLVFWC